MTVSNDTSKAPGELDCLPRLHCEYLHFVSLRNLSGEFMTLLSTEEVRCEATLCTEALVPTFCQGWMGRVDRGSWRALLSTFSLGERGHCESSLLEFS